MKLPQRDLSPHPPADRPHVEARVAAWLLEQRERLRRQELDMARLEGELAASERIERAAQRYADRLEDKLEAARRREASLARAVGYLEAQRDQLARRLGIEPEALPHRIVHELPAPAER